MKNASPVGRRGAGSHGGPKGTTENKSHDGRLGSYGFSENEGLRYLPRPPRPTQPWWVCQVWHVSVACLIDEGGGRDESVHLLGFTAVTLPGEFQFEFFQTTVGFDLEGLTLVVLHRDAQSTAAALLGR